MSDVNGLRSGKLPSFACGNISQDLSSGATSASGIDSKIPTGTLSFENSNLTARKKMRFVLFARRFTDGIIYTVIKL